MAVLESVYGAEVVVKLLEPIKILGLVTFHSCRDFVIEVKRIVAKQELHPHPVKQVAQQERLLFLLGLLQQVVLVVRKKLPDQTLKLWQNYENRGKTVRIAPMRRR